MPTTIATTYPASQRGHAKHRALPASACASRDWELSAAPPRDAGRMLPYAAYSHAYICHSHSCAYICIRIRIRIWAMAIATAMAMPGGWARCRGAAIIQRGVGQAGEADYEASWGQRKQVNRMRIAARGRGRGFKRSACTLTELVYRPPAAPGAMRRCGRAAVQRSAYGCGTALVALPSMCQMRTPIDVDIMMQVAMATVWGTTCDSHAGLETSWCLPNDAIATAHGLPN